MSHFTFLEMIKSDTAQRNNISNVPVLIEHVENIIALVDFLDVVRDELDAPIIINSAFRSPLVNADVNGAPRSLHLQGRAADIRPEYDKSFELNFQRLIDVLKSHEDELSEMIIYKGFIHIAI